MYAIYKKNIAFNYNCDKIKTPIFAPACTVRQVV